MKRRSKKDQELTDRNRLACAWRAWHREVHRDVFERLMAQLKDLHSARELVAFVSAQDWSAVNYDDRATALHLVNETICRLRERSGLTAINDPLPGQPENAFRIVKAIMSSFPHTERPAEAVFGNQSDGDVK